MSSAAAVLRTASDEEILREIRQFSPTMQLYRGSDQWYKFEFAGRDYYFPPDLDGKMVRHPVTEELVPADGILRVRSVYGRQQEKVSRKFTGAFGELDDQTVTSILKFALTNHADKGVVWLHGDETDEARKKASKATVRNFSKAWAEHQRESRAQFVDNWGKLPQNKGRRVPPPTNEQRRAQKYLDFLAEEGSEGFEFVCEHGCSDFETFEDYRRHMKVTHGKVVTQGLTQETAPAPPASADLSDAPPSAADLEAEAKARLEADEANATKQVKAEKAAKKTGQK